MVFDRGHVHRKLLFGRIIFYRYPPTLYLVSGIWAFHDACSGTVIDNDFYY